MIRHYKLFLFSGFIIFILPFLGIPQEWKTAVSFIVGGILIIISLSYRHILRMQNSNEDEVYIDSLQESKKMMYQDEVEIYKSFPPKEQDSFDDKNIDEESAEIETEEEIEPEEEVEIEEEIIEIVEMEDGDVDSISDIEDIEHDNMPSFIEEEPEPEKKPEPKKATKKKKEADEKPKKKRGRPRKVKIDL